jgi:hypothetical protein
LDRNLEQISFLHRETGAMLIFQDCKFIICFREGTEKCGRKIPNKFFYFYTPVSLESRERGAAAAASTTAAAPLNGTSAVACILYASWHRLNCKNDITL